MFLTTPTPLPMTNLAERSNYVIHPVYLYTDIECCGTFFQSSKTTYSAVTLVDEEQEDEDTITLTGRMTTTQPAQLVIKQAPKKPQRNEGTTFINCCQI